MGLYLDDFLEFWVRPEQSFKSLRRRILQIAKGAGVHYLYYTLPKKELSVAQKLREKGQDIYLPMMDGEPLFPRYMFVNEVGADFYELNRVYGACGVVVIGSQIQRISDAEIDRLKATEWTRSDACAVGAPVRIIDSPHEKRALPFRMRNAIVQARKGDRIAVWMDILGRRQVLEFSSRDVVAA